MNLLEIIDRLCAVTEALSRIVRDQALFIEQMETVDAETKKEFADKRVPVDAELDILEVGLRPYHNTGCRKGDDHA